MTVLQELLVPLEFDGDSFDSGLERTIGKASAFGSFFGNIASTVVSGAFNLLGQGIEKINGFLQSTVEEASASQDAIAQLDAVIKSTGGAAGVTSEQAQELATSLQKVTRFSDEAIIGGENMLLTFTSIGKEVFPRATETILDMSQALNQDLKSSAIQLGKALNDPIAGVSALRRVGVQFTDEQEEMIKKMVESGDLMKAQTFILDELQKEFGGSAEAAGKTFAGQLDILKNKISDIKERIGNALLPVLTTLANKFSNLLDSPKVQALIDTVVTKLGETGDWIIENLPTWIDKFDEFATNLGKWWTEDVEPILDAFSDKLDIAIPLAVNGTKLSFGFLSNFWKSTVVPIGTEVNRLLGNIGDILNLMGIKVDGNSMKWSFLVTMLGPALVKFDSLRKTLDLVKKSLDLINDILEAAKRQWDRVTASVWAMVSAVIKLGNAMPYWLIPHSPTPLEMGLRGIDNAMSNLNKTNLPQFSGNMGATKNANSGSSSGIDYQIFARILATELSKQYG